MGGGGRVEVSSGGAPWAREQLELSPTSRLKSPRHVTDRPDRAGWAAGPPEYLIDMTQASSVQPAHRDRPPACCHAVRRHRRAPPPTCAVSQHLHKRHSLPAQEALPQPSAAGGEGGGGRGCSECWIGPRSRPRRHTTTRWSIRPGEVARRAPGCSTEQTALIAGAKQSAVWRARPR